MSTRIRLWNVEHGSATHVTTPDGKVIVIDMGSSSNVSPLKALVGRTAIDRLIVTHPHYDHIEDILALGSHEPESFSRPSHLTRQEILGGPLSAYGTEARRIFEKYFALSAKYTVPANPLTDPTNPANNGGAKIEIFRPANCDRSNINNHSLVTVVEHAGIKVLIPGDNEACSWEELLSLYSFRQAIKDTRILVAAHHGRESGFYANLFKYISPWLTIVSDGREVDTSVTPRYTAVSSGFPVTSRSSGLKRDRYCVTTRNDGDIEVVFGPGLGVTID